MIEAITDATILTNESANGAANSAFGIAGHENGSGNDGPITRFGWKAQNNSSVVFSGEAYNFFTLVIGATGSAGLVGFNRSWWCRPRHAADAISENKQVMRGKPIAFGECEV